MTKKEDEKITFQNWAIKNNISDMTLAGFKADNGLEMQDLKSEKELDKAYKKYLEKPGFIKQE